MSSTATKTGAGATGGKGTDAAEAEGAKGGRKKLLLVAVLVLAVGAAAAWWFLLRGGSAAAAAPKAKPAPVAGEVLTADPISINLADGHYLKVGLALQEVQGASEVKDTSRALDAAITLYSGRPMGDLSDPTSREVLKKQLVEAVSKAYDEQVFDVYFTEYVMQ